MCCHRRAAVRVMEVRAAYAECDFEWDNCRRVCGEGLRAANVALMRRHAEARFAPAVEAGGGEGARREGGGGPPPPEG
jgi:hypothetical protein